MSNNVLFQEVGDLSLGFECNGISSVVCILCLTKLVSLLVEEFREFLTEGF